MGNDHGRLELTRRGVAGAGLGALALAAGCGPYGYSTEQRAVITRHWYRLIGTDQILRAETLTGGHDAFYLYRENADGSLTETGVVLRRDGNVDYASGDDPLGPYLDAKVERDLIDPPEAFTREERLHRSVLGLPADIHGGE